MAKKGGVITLLETPKAPLSQAPVLGGLLWRQDCCPKAKRPCREPQQRRPVSERL